MLGRSTIGAASTRATAIASSASPESSSRATPSATGWLFADALDEDLIDANPCRVRRRELPVSKDKDPLWRTRAVFTRREVEQLISHTRLPEERRLIHALLFLTGTRFGELAALRWSHWDSALEPLGRLLVAVSYSVHL